MAENNPPPPLTIDQKLERLADMMTNENRSLKLMIAESNDKLDAFQTTMATNFNTLSAQVQDNQTAIRQGNSGKDNPATLPSGGQSNVLPEGENGVPLDSGRSSVEDKFHDFNQDDVVDKINNKNQEHESRLLAAATAATGQPTPTIPVRHRHNRAPVDIDSTSMAMQSIVATTWYKTEIKSAVNNWSLKEVWAPQSLAKNSINMFEYNVTGEDMEWLQSLPVIPDREGSNQDPNHRLMTIVDHQKMNNAFTNSVPPITKEEKGRFKAYIEGRFWEHACRQHVTDHTILKCTLFKKLLTHFPELCINEMKPRSSAMTALTAKAYILEVLKKFQPLNEKEIYRISFEKCMQQDRPIDTYFDVKKRYFVRAYGSNPSATEWNLFFRSLHNNMRSKTLARDMTARRIEFNSVPPDLSKYRDLLVRSAQAILASYPDLYTREDAKGCKTFAFPGMHSDSHKNKGSSKNPIVINKVDKKKNSSESEEIYDSGSDQYTSENSEEESETVDQEKEQENNEIDLYIYNVQEKKPQELITCWFCGKAGHKMNVCFDKKNKKAPNPMGIWKQRETEYLAKKKVSPKKKSAKKPSKNVQVNQVTSENTETTPESSTVQDPLINHITDFHGLFPFPYNFDE